MTIPLNHEGRLICRIKLQVTPGVTFAGAVSAQGRGVACTIFESGGPPGVSVQGPERYPVGGEARWGGAGAACAAPTPAGGDSSVVEP